MEFRIYSILKLFFKYSRLTCGKIRLLVLQQILHKFQRNLMNAPKAEQNGIKYRVGISQYQYLSFAVYLAWMCSTFITVVALDFPIGAQDIAAWWEVGKDVFTCTLCIDY